MSNCACDQPWNYRTRTLFLVVNSRPRLMNKVCIAVPCVVLVNFNSSAK